MDTSSFEVDVDEETKDEQPGRWVNVKKWLANELKEAHAAVAGRAREEGQRPRGGDSALGRPSIDSFRCWRWRS